jgi:hypothetical protein
LIKIKSLQISDKDLTFFTLGIFTSLRNKKEQVISMNEIASPVVYVCFLVVALSCYELKTAA